MMRDISNVNVCGILVVPELLYVIRLANLPGVRDHQMFAYYTAKADNLLYTLLVDMSTEMPLAVPLCL